MAFPYLADEGFEAGTIGTFDVETDTESRLDIAHYAQLARIPGMAMPHRGAYCLRVALANDGSPADAYVQETGGFDAAADGTVHLRFAFWLSPDTVMANNDEFAIFQIWSGASTVEGGVYINYTTASGFRVGIGEASASQLKTLPLGAWHQMEVVYNVDAGGGNDGTIDAFLNGSAYTQVATLDQGAITSAVFGVMSQDAGTTTGTLLIDDITADDARVYQITDRYPHVMTLTASGHAFVGPGMLENVTLQSGADVNSVCRVWDTDTGSTNDLSNLKLELKNTAADEFVPSGTGTPIMNFRRGCYVELAPGPGANQCMAIVNICRSITHSDGAKRNYGLRRTPHPVLG